MTFDTIFDLLAWYVRGGWVRGPKSPGNHDWAMLPGGGRVDNIEEVWLTCFTIRRVIETLSNRDGQVILDLFEEKRPDFKGVAQKYNCSTKTISRIRFKVLNRLERAFEEAGLLMVKEPEPPIYMGVSWSVSG